MPFSQVFFWAVPITALTAYVLLSLFLYLSQKDKYIKLFMLVLASLIVWTAGSLFMKLDLYPGVLIWNRVMVVGTLATPFFIYIFVSVFTGTLNWLWTSVLGLLSLASVVLNVLGYVVSNASIITNVVNNNGYQYKTVEFVYTVGPAAYPIYAIMFGIILSIIYKASFGVKHGNVAYGQIGLIVVGTSIMFLGALLNLFPAIGKYPIDILACFINSIFIMIALYKYRMLELRFVITRGIVYSIFALLLTAVYVYLVIYIEHHTNQFYGDAIPYFSALSALAVAFIFQPLYKLSSNLVDRMFQRADFARRQALRNFSSVISNILDLDRIATELIDSVQVAIKAKNVMILTIDEDENSFSVFKTSSQIFKPELRIPADNPIIAWFANNHSSLSRDELYALPFFKSMWEKEKRELYDLGIEVIIPIKSRNEIIGLLMLSRKESNASYTMDDLDLLAYLGASTAVAFDNARLFTRSQNEALTDSLTKLYNHRYFVKTLAEQLKKVGSSQLSILMIDLDLFKLFNDLYGHVEGDSALETVAEILTRNVGQKGTVCRYGGEEFTIILPYHDSKMAYDVAEKIRLDIQRTFFNMTDVTKRFLTASIGVCTYPQAAPDGEELLKRADLAMYTAKNQGKNQTVIYTPEIVSEETENFDSAQSISMQPTYATTIYALTAAIDAKDHYTFGHSQKVADYATTLAGKLALDKSHVEIIREAALLHDIGKIGIPENILTKTGRLTNEEFDIVKQHVEMSITIIKHLPSLNHVIPAVLGHHERWDGKGYPRGLKGEAIPLSARCLAIVDAFDAMTSNRPYRSCLSVNAALNEIEENIGSQFDPLLANLFIKLVREGSIKVDQNLNIKHVS